MMRKRLHVVVAIAAMMLSSLLMVPVRAGQAEVDLLTAYVGSWQGKGVLVGGKSPESFGCRLTIAKGNQSKINYAGRCALIDMNLSVSGTISYVDKARRYEAIMSSNAGFTGIAVGQQQGDKISFNLAEQQTDKGGNAVRIGARITLIGKESITVDFEVEFNNSGHVLTASVPFTK